MAKNQKFTLFLRMVWYNSNLIIEVGWIFFKKSTLRKCEFEEKEEKRKLFWWKSEEREGEEPKRTSRFSS